LFVQAEIVEHSFRLTACRPLEHDGISLSTVNLVIEPSPEGATGNSYLVYPGVRRIGADLDHSRQVGGYQDLYVRTQQGWRIKKRIHIFPPGVPGSFVFP
jgi:hypothetical protein